MAHAAMIAVHAANAAAQAQAKVLDAFRVRSATAPERALPLAELGLSSADRTLGALIASGVVRAVDSRGRPAVIGHESARPAGFYLDEGAYISQRDRRTQTSRRVVLVALAVLFGTFAILIGILAARGP